MTYIRVLSLIALAVCLCPRGLAHAQDEADFQAAARAFQQGQQSQLRGDHERAAELFELADDLAPSPQALRSAIRNHRAAGNDAWAATLALRAFRRPGVDAASRRLSEQVLSELEPTLGRVILRCTPRCNVVLDQQPRTTHESDVHELFVTIGEHTIQAAWEGTVSDPRAFEVQAEAIERVSFEAPAPEEEAVEAPDDPDGVAPLTPRTTTEVDEDEGSGLSPIVFFVGLGLSAAAGGIYLWSLLDTLSLRDEYVAGPTMALYDDGVSAQTRTIVIGSIAAALAAGTLAIGLFFTRWSSSDEDESEAAATLPGVWLTEHGGGVTLAGSFGGGS